MLQSSKYCIFDKRQRFLVACSWPPVHRIYSWCCVYSYLARAVLTSEAGIVSDLRVQWRVRECEHNIQNTCDLFWQEQVMDFSIIKTIIINNRVRAHLWNTKTVQWTRSPSLLAINSWPCIKGKQVNSYVAQYPILGATQSAWHVTTRFPLLEHHLSRFGKLSATLRLIRKDYTHKNIHHCITSYLCVSDDSRTIFFLVKNKTASGLLWLYLNSFLKRNC